MWGDSMVTVVQEKNETELWSRFQRTRSREARNDLVLQYGWLVRSIVRRLAAVSGNYVDAEDLASYGMLGLIEAVEKFDESKGVTFETFATYRVRGEIIDYMRRNDWVPRSVRKRVTDVENAMNDLMSELGRRPTDGELAAKLGVDGRGLRQTLADRERYNLISFEELLYDSARVCGEPCDSETPESRLQESELLDVLAKTLDSLPEREKLILTLYYYEELTLREISGILGVSESRVSQIHSRAVRRMRKSLQDYMNQ